MVGHSLPVVLSLLAALGCGDQVGDLHLQGEAKGYLSIALPGDAPISLEGLAPIAIEQVQRIDGYTADLVPIAWVGAAKSGGTALIMLQDRQVRLYGPDGRLIATVGRSGEGPNEFTYPIRGGWKGDSLWIADGTLRRVTIIDEAGHVVRLIPPLMKAEWKERANGFRYSTPSMYALLVADSMIVVGAPPGARGMHLLRVGPEGWIDRLVQELRPTDEGRILYASSSTGASGGALPIPFYPHQVWRVSPYGGTIATIESGPDSNHFRATAITASGDTIYSRLYGVTAVRIPPDVIDSVLTAGATREERPEVRRLYQLEMRGHVPQTYPAYGHAVLDDHNCLWVKIRLGGDRYEWVRIDSRGDPAGMVELPARTAISAARGTGLWVVETDDSDVESVIRYEVKRCEGER